MTDLSILTISIKELNLRGNGFRGLPKQLEDRKFARLRRLDLSNNPLGGEWEGRKEGRKEGKEV